MIERWQKSKPQKFPRASNKTPQNTWTKHWIDLKKNPMPNFCRTTRLGYMGTTTNLESVLNTQKNTCQIFLTPKNPESKSSNPKTPCIIRVNWNPEYPPPPPLRWTLRYTLLYSCSNLAAISWRCLLVRAPRIAIIASSSLPVIDRKRKKQRQRARVFK